MSIDTDDAPEIEPREKLTPWTIAAGVVLLLLFGLIAAAGVRGCFSSDPQATAEEEAKKKEEEEKKKLPEFNLSSPLVQPAEPEMSAIALVKPGHWATASQQMRANYRDFVGTSYSTIADSRDRSFPLARTPYVLRASRPVVLIKGRPKSIEGTFFVPAAAEQLRLLTDLTEHGLGTPLRQPFTPLAPMPSYQYHFVVLAKEPTRYAFIKTLDSVHVPYDGESDMDDTEDPLHYRVVQLKVDQSIPLSDNPLTWTTTAYVLWDEIDPKLFTPEQQQALVDWIHWGGQLIISGPGSLDLLRGSFLEPLLPATRGDTHLITANDPVIDELNEGWLISGGPGRPAPLAPTVPWSAVKLQYDPQLARPIPSTGELLVERSVGRGRIVVSGIHLAEREFVNWRGGFESFFNACLLRREPREWRKGYFGDATLAWDDRAKPELSGRRLDARLMTRLQYLSRDLGIDTNYRYVDIDDQLMEFQRRRMNVSPTREFRPPDHVGGIGAWNDFNATANAARNALREAAGVEVPGASFVVFCLAAYLIALVPLNWLVFQTLGRVEWAWIAAPLIAVASTFVVVHQAQLDIGFVRAQTEIGVIELQPGHARGHLSRYTALYSSLSTTYDLEFGNLTTLAAPFPSQEDFQMLRGQGHTVVDFQRYDNVRLAGMPVASNSTSMVHSEQMVAFDGPIKLGQSTASRRHQIENLSQLSLRSVGVVYRPTDEEASRGRTSLEGQWFGDLGAGQSVAVSERLPRIPESADAVPFAEERAAEARRMRGDALNLEPLFQLAFKAEHLEPGETRLVGRVDEALSGQVVTPAASQLRGATLVVAHLRYADLAPPRPDRNSRRDVMANADD